MTTNKTILLLGGSAQQVIAIETAKRLGYRTILCDYLHDNPGQFHADVFRLVSTTDKKAVLKVAQEEQVDGVLAYASDPAAPTAAFVAEKLGLKGNSLESVEILCNKDRFRDFLLKNGFNAPVSRGYSTTETAILDQKKFHLPVIIKPVDSSGSKGVTVLQDWKELGKALDFGFAYSRSHRIIIEEFIEKAHPYLIGGDLFVVEGKVVLWGLLNCHRDSRVNPLVPVGKSFPLELSEEKLNAVKTTLQQMIDRLGIRMGAMNVELIVSSDGRVWPIDVGPRNGGNMIPDLLGMIYHVDIVEMSIQVAMGKKIACNTQSAVPFYATHNLHSIKNGIFDKISFSEDLQKYLVRTCIYKEKGDTVEYFDNASKAIGIIFMKFDNKENMNKILSTIDDHIDIVYCD